MASRTLSIGLAIVCAALIPDVVEPFHTPLAVVAASGRGRGVCTVAHQHKRISAAPSPWVRHHDDRVYSSPSSIEFSHHPQHILKLSSLHLQLSPNDNYINDDGQPIDSLIYRTSTTLRATSWFSWWSQVILTVISSVTFLFARNVMDAQVAGAVGAPLELRNIASKFFLPGLGVVISSMSIVWTWGQRRLARRIVRRSSSSRVEAANLLRRVIKVGVTLNLLGLLTSVLGAQYIVGTLVAKSMSSFVGGGGFGGFGGGGLVASQTLQPLDVLVVQANTNVLSSHFVSLACLLWLTRMVDLLDPPSLEDDE